MPDILQGLAWVALGSALGGMARFFVSGLIGRWIGETFPWGTLVVNLTGAFALGWLASAVAGEAGAAWQLGAVGVLGSYTTVSSLSLQTLALARDGETLRAGINVALSVVLGLGAAVLGLVAGAAGLAP